MLSMMSAQQTAKWNLGTPLEVSFLILLLNGDSHTERRDSEKPYQSYFTWSECCEVVSVFILWNTGKLAQHNVLSPKNVITATYRVSSKHEYCNKVKR